VSAKGPKIPKTNAARLLDELGVPYAIKACQVPADDLSAETAARLLGLPEEMVLKTLVLKGDRTGLVEACLPAGTELDLKALAAASGNRSVALVPTKDLFELTGYQRGGCSPLAGKRPVPVYLSDLALGLDRVAVNAGARGVMLVLAPSDLIKAAGAVPAAIARRNGPPVAAAR
jgi:Cys-tRNA(Pro)/Cys-tRNA(Cys) deacylase